MTAEHNKLLIHRLVEEAVNNSDLDVLAEIADGDFARAARQWRGPFRASFPDFRMEIAEWHQTDDEVGIAGRYRALPARLLAGPRPKS